MPDERAVFVERRAFVEQRDRAAARHASCEGASEPGENAQQARFADPVRPGQLQRVARLQLEPEAREEQPVALAAGEIGGGEMGPLHGHAA